MAFERRRQRLAPVHVFVARMIGALVLVTALIAASLAVGMWGYHHYEGMDWIDAYANASMILSGMGPMATLKTAAGKLFAGSYALYSGLFLIFAAGIILAPLLHRLIHSFHLDDDQTGS